MNYMTEMYLDYLEEAPEYENIYNLFLEYWVLHEIPVKLSTDVAAKLKQLIANKNAAEAAGNASQVATLNAQINSLTTGAQAAYATGAPAAAAVAQNKAAVAMPTAGAPSAKAIAQNKADMDIATRSGGTPQTAFKQQTDTLDTAAIAPSGARPSTFDPAGVDKVQTAADTAAKTAADQAALAKDAASLKTASGQQAAGAAVKPEVTPPAGVDPDSLRGQATDVAGRVGDAVKGAYDTASGAVASGTQGALSKAGVDPTLAQGLGQAMGSPLGMAALGGAAAFGGYKLYKRFLSKSARSCRGYSGADKTGCMKSYMNAKKGQAATRGADIAGAT